MQKQCFPVAALPSELSRFRYHGATAPCLVWISPLHEPSRPPVGPGKHAVTAARRSTPGAVRCDRLPGCRRFMPSALTSAPLLCCSARSRRFFVTQTAPGRLWAGGRNCLDARGRDSLRPLSVNEPTQAGPSAGWQYATPLGVRPDVGCTDEGPSLLAGGHLMGAAGSSQPSH